jgi:hypothetical protein
MNSETAAVLIQEGSKLISAAFRAVALRPPKPKLIDTPTPPAETTRKIVQPSIATEHPVSSKISLPNREETTRELKRRLARELYKAELDLANGLMIAGKPCDCLSEKHTLQLDAGAEELVSQDPTNSVYQEIRQWIVNNQHKITPSAIISGKYKKEYPHMALQFKEFRKRTLDTADVAEVKTIPMQKHELTLEEAKIIAAEQAAAKVERIWNAQKSKE